MISADLTAPVLALYLAAAVGFGAVLFLHAPAAPRAAAGNQLLHAARFGRPLLLAGILVQFVAIGAWCMTTHRSPFASQFGTLSVFAWAIAIAFAALDFRVRLPAVGAVALSVACVVLFWGMIHAGGPIGTASVLRRPGVTIHVLAILASFALFALAFGCAALYLVQNRLLKAHQVKGLFRRLPPLETLDRIAYHSVAYALPLLTLGLALGLADALASGFFGRPALWLTDPKILMSLATWALYVFYLAARLIGGWGGARLQYILLIGLLVALAVYAVPTSTHRFS